MPGPCALRAHCAGQDYCPCVVRRLLADYAELLEQRTVLLERHHGDATKVKGKRPAHEVLEDQIARKADVALALLALLAADPEIGRAVALAHNLDIRRGAIVYVGRRDERTGRIPAPSARRVGRQVWAGFHAAAVSEVQRELIARMIDDGHTWMARRLGWIVGEEEAA